jgi:hypothetical protein
MPQMRFVVGVICVMGAFTLSPAASEPSCGGSSTVKDYSSAIVPRASAFLSALQRAVATNDKESIAGMLRYPVRVNDIKDIRSLPNPAAFVRNYAAIVSPKMKAAIEAQTAKCLFANWQGLMVGDGEVWFSPLPDRTVKIVTFNVPQDDQANCARWERVHRVSSSQTVA